MITARKLAELSLGIQRRKLVAIWSDWQRQNSQERDDPILQEQFRELATLTRGLVKVAATTSVPTEDDVRLWRRRLLDQLGFSEADWDLQAPPDRHIEAIRKFPFVGFLEDLRSPFNVGSIFRTAEAYGWQSLILSTTTPAPPHPRTIRSAMGTHELISWQQVHLEEWQEIWGEKPVFALELGGTSVENFVFPADLMGNPIPATVLVGNEELGLSHEALAWAERSLGRVSLPLFGQKASLNVGVAFGVLASWWTARFTS